MDGGSAGIVPASRRGCRESRLQKAALRSQSWVSGRLGATASGQTDIPRRMTWPISETTFRRDPAVSPGVFPTASGKRRIPRSLTLAALPTRRRSTRGNPFHAVGEELAHTWLRARRASSAGLHRFRSATLLTDTAALGARGAEGYGRVLVPGPQHEVVRDNDGEGVVQRTCGWARQRIPPPGSNWAPGKGAK
jgi:hypothetical protein